MAWSHYNGYTRALARVTVLKLTIATLDIASATINASKS